MGSLGATNGHSGLPNSSSPDIYLTLATPEEAAAQTHVNSVEWKGALPTVDAYVRREEHLASQELTKDGGLTIWALIYQPAGHKRKALCGCETIKKKALVGRNGKVEEVIVHGVGSVFTPPENRGKGYVRRMMTDLAKRLQTWQVDNGKRSLFSVLYSDIGKQFYSTHGWHPFSSAHVSLPVDAAVADGLPSVRFLRSTDIPELCVVDERTIRRRLAGSKGSNRSAVALLPDNLTIRWHHAREEFVSDELFRRTPEIKGAIVGEPGSRVWCYWTRVWKDPAEDESNTLHVLRLAIEDKSFADFAPASPEETDNAKGLAIVKSIASLFAAAQSEAAKWSMDEVQIWNPTSTTLAAAQLLNPSVTIQHRTQDSIPSLLWYGEDSWENVDWICDEKFGWC